MSFKSVNETDKFRYDDCILHKTEFGEDFILMELEALIVKADNSQNTQYVESYAGDTTLTFKNGKITGLKKQGYKYYDAGDRLVEEVPDTEMSVALTDMKKMLSGVFLFSVGKTPEDRYLLLIEMPETEPGVIADTYEVEIEAGDVIFAWEKYMNRVQG